jgi:hypothetical protein
MVIDEKPALSSSSSTSLSNDNKQKINKDNLIKRKFGDEIKVQKIRSSTQNKTAATTNNNSIKQSKSVDKTKKIT